jgi:hypothetical protein
MAPDDGVEPGRGGRLRHANHQAGANPGAEPTRGRGGHGGRGFPRGNDTAGVVRIFRSAVARSPEGLHDICIERPLDQRIGGARADTGPDDGQEVLSKL